LGIYSERGVAPLPRGVSPFLNCDVFPPTLSEPEAVRDPERRQKALDFRWEELRMGWLRRTNRLLQYPISIQKSEMEGVGVWPFGSVDKDIQLGLRGC